MNGLVALPCITVSLTLRLETGSESYLQAKHRTHISCNRDGTTLAESSTRRDGGAVDTPSKHRKVPEKKNFNSLVRGSCQNVVTYLDQVSMGTHGNGSSLRHILWEIK